jgi:hypothetical protein
MYHEFAWAMNGLLLAPVIMLLGAAIAKGNKVAIYAGIPAFFLVLSIFVIYFEQHKDFVAWAVGGLVAGFLTIAVWKISTIARKRK